MNEIDVRDALTQVTDDVNEKTGSGLKNGLVGSGIALGSVLIWEGGKWAFKKIKKAWSKRKDKKKSEEETIELDGVDVRDLPDID